MFLDPTGPMCRPPEFPIPPARAAEHRLIGQFWRELRRKRRGRVASRQAGGRSSKGTGLLPGNSTGRFQMPGVCAVSVLRTPFLQQTIEHRFHGRRISGWMASGSERRSGQFPPSPKIRSGWSGGFSSHPPSRSVFGLNEPYPPCFEPDPGLFPGFVGFGIPGAFRTSNMTLLHIALRNHSSTPPTHRVRAASLIRTGPSWDYWRWELSPAIWRASTVSPEQHGVNDTRQPVPWLQHRNGGTSRHGNHLHLRLQPLGTPRIVEDRSNPYTRR